jgi:hypothetical protein
MLIIKRATLMFGTAALAFAWALPSRTQVDDSKKVMTWTGDIMDAQCATEGTHEKMMPKMQAKNAEQCTLMCAKNGSFVLYDVDSKTVYQLEDQKKPLQFAGQRVRITGTYEAASKTITAKTIEAAPKAGANKVASLR